MTAYAHRRPRPTNIWPGFVDAFAALIMVLIFVVLVFFLAQLFLSGALSGRDSALDTLRRRVNELSELLSLERYANEELRTNLAQLSDDLRASLSSRDDLSHQLRLALDRSEVAETRLRESDRALAVAAMQAQSNKDAAAAQSAKLVTLNQQVAALQALKEQMQREAAELAERVAENEKAALVEREVSESARAQVALLNKQLAALREQISALNEALAAAEKTASEQNVQIQSLGQRLNAALAGRVHELSRYRSEFFGRLREVLGNHPDIRIVGDRFVFQSEVLFATASAEIDVMGREQIRKVAEILRSVSADIPPEITWIVQVNGHTDRRPIRSDRFASNWELSQSRALSVVQLLVDFGVSAERLAAAGFGEYQPLDATENEAAFRRNRRIELKLTQP